MPKVYAACEECYCQIEKESIYAAHAWKHLCNMWTEDTYVFEINLKIHPKPYGKRTEIIQILETMGFVVTTERGDSMVVGKLLGVEENAGHICIRNHLSKKDPP